MKTTEIKSIAINARRWFQKSYGNTYHTSKVYINGEYVLTVKETYGYGDHFITTAFEALIKAGVIEGIETGYDCGWSWCRDNNIRFVDNAVDVNRKKDLH